MPLALSGTKPDRSLISDRLWQLYELAATSPLLGVHRFLVTALGFRDLTNQIARSLLETGGFMARPHLVWDERSALRLTRLGCIESRFGDGGD